MRKTSRSRCRWIRPSSYARQFLGQMEKPKVDFIGGLSPAIAIEQKAVSKNPRSTVATVTEIYDYLRVLFANLGTPHCPECGREVHAQSAQEIVDQIAGLLAELIDVFLHAISHIDQRIDLVPFVLLACMGQHLADLGMPALTVNLTHEPG